MYIPIAPLLDLSILLKTLRSEGPTLLGCPWHMNPGTNLRFFPRGAYALASAARAVARRRERPVCFFPSYFCNQSLDPLRWVGAEVIFYRTREDFCPDWDDVYRLAQKKQPDLFVLVHYFGLINDYAGALSFTKECGCLLLEDCAHVLTPCEDIGQTNSIQLYCPHKLLCLPPIALLAYSESVFPVSLEHHKAGWKKEDSIWVVKRVIQMLIVAMALNAFWETRRYFSKRNQRQKDHFINENNIARARTSLLGLLGLEAFQNELNEVSSKRCSNYAYLAAMLGELTENKNILPWPSWPEGQVPYLFPLNISHGHIDSVLHALHEKHIPAHKWPDLPPEVLNNPKYYQKAWELRDKFLFLPIHQSLTKKQLEYMANSLVDALKGGH